MGKIIVIEGTDGSGKQTQSNLLCEKLCEMGYNAKRLSFPNYESPSAGPLKMYLGGELGQNAKDINAYQASALFAVDRLCTMRQYREFLQNGGILVLDRYVQSNMIHQAGKIADNWERDKFLRWLDEFEFETLGLPRANKVFFLDVPVDVSQKLANARSELKNGEKKDIHEQDKNHLLDAYSAAKYVANMFGWETVKCINEKKNLKSIEKINQILLKDTLAFIQNEDIKENEKHSDKKDLT